MTRGGFTLVEVLVAAVVLEVGLLAVVGTLLLAARTLAEARGREAVTSRLEAVYDSLAAGGVPGTQGEAEFPPGTVRWGVDGTGGITVEFLQAGVSRASLHGAVWR